MTDDNHVHHLVLTGGPSAGKTTATSHLVEQLSARGWRVLLVPEAATIFIAGGVSDIGHLAQADRESYLAVQRALIRTQISLRQHFDSLARSLGGKVLVLHDRGVVDDRAYMSESEYEDTLADHNLTVASAYDLYDSVLHLRSAAVVRQGYQGEGYTNANNAARLESAEEAAALDEATLSAWIGPST